MLCYNNTMNKKEIAKFIAGVSAWEAIIHVGLMQGGLIPIVLFGFNIDSTINTILIIFPALLSIFLIYYAWVR